MKQYHRIVFVEEFYNTIKQVHFEELLHASYKKTFEKFAYSYSWLIYNSFINVHVSVNV